jgi:hypothetical protein
MTTDMFSKVAGRLLRHETGWRRLARIAAGGTLLGVGVVLLFVPGPGIPFVVAGLVLLEWDFPWARRLRVHISELVPRGRAWA